MKNFHKKAFGIAVVICTALGVASLYPVAIGERSPNQKTGSRKTYTKKLKSKPKVTKPYLKARLDTINRRISAISGSNKKQLARLQAEKKDIEKQLKKLESQSERFDL